MGQVLEFKMRRQQPQEDLRPAAPIRSRLHDENDSGHGKGVTEAGPMTHVEQFIDLKAMGVAEMIKQSALMQVISTLAFYAKQGYDGGDKARRALLAMQEIMVAEAPETAPAV